MLKTMHKPRMSFEDPLNILSQAATKLYSLWVTDLSIRIQRQPPLYRPYDLAEQASGCRNQDRQLCYNQKPCMA